MKERYGLVTNSSCSSFVIQKGQVSRGELLEILLEIANASCRKHGWEEYSWEDVNGTCVAFNYNIREANHEYPYYGPQNTFYENHFVIDNGECAKYDWDVIEDVLKAHNIEWTKCWEE